MRVRATFTLAAIAVALAAPRAAAADTIGVLPFSADDRVAIYASPVSQAIATELRKRGKLRAELVPFTGPSPKHVTLKVDGRIVVEKGDLVLLEGWATDPRRGVKVVKPVATRPRKLDEIDQLAVELATALAPKLRKALVELERVRREEARARAQKRTIRLPKTVVRGTRPVQPPTPAASSDKRPRMLVAHVGGEPAHSNIVTPHAYWLAERLGYRPVASDLRGIGKRAEIVAALAASKAELALLMEVRGVELEWSKVPWGRGRIRVVLVSRAGDVLFDRTARTGTLVGSRGDGNQAVVHYIAEQAVEIVVPHLKRLLGETP